ncbi:3834_t:CDS:2 [Acaulospora colombiana]|uniref:3834_t:CDS:1 n=1 Tax=Acaulospora colombiana TaxID=27376 RepID=A0ACA9L2S8_9GLOM|nr:3834_t:CDS:2 [Acaulospora colombiana]
MFVNAAQLDVAGPRPTALPPPSILGVLRRPRPVDDRHPELEKKLEKLDPIPDLHNFPTRDGATTPCSSNDVSTSAHQRSRGESNFDDLPTWDSEFDFSVEDLRTWVRDSLDQLAHLRSEVSARLPDLEEVKSHFPDFEFDFELPNLNVDEFLARLSRMEVPNLSSSFGDVKSRIGDLGYEYLPALSERLSNLHSHLKSRSSQLPNGSEFRTMALDKANTILRDFIDTLMYNEEDSPLERTRVILEVEQTAVQVQQALRTSMPLKWRNNEHVLHGYRFIPASEWPTLLLSTFHLHNETANIHTHLLPLLILGPMFAYEAYTATSALTVLPTTLFSIFAMLCLITSVAWHICAGCASPQVMETAARIDYLGIGWLISASIATVVYYSFSCRKMAFSIYLSMNILAGLAGSILPFMQWFNERKHKKWRILPTLLACHSTPSTFPNACGQLTTTATATLCTKRSTKPRHYLQDGQIGSGEEVTPFGTLLLSPLFCYIEMRFLHSPRGWEGNAVMSGDGTDELCIIFDILFRQKLGRWFPDTPAASPIDGGTIECI